MNNALQVIFGGMQLAGCVGGIIAIFGGLAGGDRKMIGLAGFFSACSLLAGATGMAMVTP